MLRLFPFFTLTHMGAVRRYVLGGGASWTSWKNAEGSDAGSPGPRSGPPDSFALRDWSPLSGVGASRPPSLADATLPAVPEPEAAAAPPPPTSPMRPSRYASGPCAPLDSFAPCTVTARVERLLEADGQCGTTMLPPLRPTETPARALGLRLPRTQFVEIGGPSYDPPSTGRRSRPPAPAPRYLTDERGVVRWRSGVVVHTRLVACTERIAILGPEPGVSAVREIYRARFDVPQRLFLIHARSRSSILGTPPGAEPHSSAAAPTLPDPCSRYESYLEIWPGLVGMAPRPELVGVRCDDPRARFALVATEPADLVPRRIQLIPRPGQEPVWELPEEECTESPGVLDMRRFVRLALLAEVPGPVEQPRDLVLPELWVRVCTLGRLMRVE
jgi:hypothetical protein